MRVVLNEWPLDNVQRAPLQEIMRDGDVSARQYAHPGEEHHPYKTVSPTTCGGGCGGTCESCKSKATMTSVARESASKAIISSADQAKDNVDAALANVQASMAAAAANATRSADAAFIIPDSNILLTRSSDREEVIISTPVEIAKRGCRYSIQTLDGEAIQGDLKDGITRINTAGRKVIVVLTCGGVTVRNQLV